MQRLALLVAAAYATDSNYTTIVYTATGAQPNYATGFLESQYSFVGLSAELSHHEFEEPDEFTFWLGPQGATTAEALLNKTHECDFRWGLVNALETQGMLAEVELTHACITVELGVGCDESHGFSPYCPTNRTTTHRDDLAAGAIFAIVVGVLVALAMLIGCCCLCYSHRERLFARYREPKRNVFFNRPGVTLPPLAEYIH